MRTNPKSVYKSATGTDKLIDISTLPPPLQKQIEKLALVDIYKDQAKQKIKARQVHIKRHFTQFIAGLNSPQTKRAYSKAIKDFMNYASNSGATHPLLVKAELVDRYITYLKEKLSNNSIRLRVAAVSSFYEKLKRYDLVEGNPFHGAKLPRKQYKKAVELDGEKTSLVMDEADYRVLVQATKKNARLWLAIHFMATYGLRVGALPSIKIAQDYFTYTTKAGKGGRHNLTEETKKIIATKKIISPSNSRARKSSSQQAPMPSPMPFALSTMLYPMLSPKHPFRSLSEGVIRVSLSRVVKKLVAQKKIKHPYSSHDFRHFFAVRHYRMHKDLYALCQLLDHASISITEIYLKSIKCN